MNGVIVFATKVSGGVEHCSQMTYLMSIQPRAEMKKRMIML